MASRINISASYTENMASGDTRSLLERVEQLTTDAQYSSPESWARFEDAVNRLDQLAGRSPDARERALQGLVLDLLSEDESAIVSREPRTSGAMSSVDFLVKRDDEVVLVQVKTPRQSTGTKDLDFEIDRLSRLIDRYQADLALLVVPWPADNLASVDPRVKVVAVNDLRRAWRSDKATQAETLFDT